MSEKGAYILGTDKEELHRLGLQHQVWAEEAQKGWQKAKFSKGDVLLDLGCGPGFCTKELGYIVGEEGKVIGIDKSEQYIHYLSQVAELHQLPIEGITDEFDNLTLQAESLDGMYCRWALAWIPNPKEILIKTRDALKKGGKMVLHEYYDWSTHQTQPAKTGLDKAIQACLKSFKEQPGDIDVGRHLPEMLNEIGMKVTSVRLMSKLATPEQLTWQWPNSFYHIYFPKLQQMGYLKEDEVAQALADMNELSQTPGATLFCPILIEVIAEKQ